MNKASEIKFSEKDMDKAYDQGFKDGAIGNFSEKDIKAAYEDGFLSGTCQQKRKYFDKPSCGIDTAWRQSKTKREFSE